MRKDEPPGMTRLDRASAVRTGLALAAVSGLFLVKGLAVHQAGDSIGLIITYLLIFWGASGAGWDQGEGVDRGRRHGSGHECYGVKPEFRTPNSEFRIPNSELPKSPRMRGDTASRSSDVGGDPSHRTRGDEIKAFQAAC